MTDGAESTIVRTPRDLGAAIRDRRKRLGLDQRELARRIGASRQWVIEAERGKPRAELGLILRALGGLGLEVTLGQPDDAPGREPEIDIDAIVDDARGEPS